MIKYKRANRTWEHSSDWHPMRTGELIYSCGYLRVGGRVLHGTALNAYLESMDEGWNEWSKVMVSWSGCYFIASLDAEQRQLRWTHDVLGYETHYLGMSDDVFILTDDFWKCLQYMPARPIDKSAVIEFLSYRFLQGDKTFHPSIKTSQPGAHSHFDPQRWSIESSAYAKPMDSSEAVPSDAIEGLHETLESICCDFVATYDTYQLTLTGGLDSRYLATLLHHQGEMSGLVFGRPDSEDVRFARQVARTLSMDIYVSEAGESLAKSFYDTSNIDRLLKASGASTFHYQSLAIRQMVEGHTDSTPLVLGIDGCWMGLNFRADVHAQGDIKDNVNETLIEDWANFMPVEDFTALTGISPKERDTSLRDSFQSRSGETAWATYMNQMFFSKARRYISAPHRQLSGSRPLFLPYTEREWLNVCAGLEADHLQGQRAFLEAYTTFIRSRFPALEHVPFELRKVLKHNGWMSLKQRHRPVYQRVMNKLRNRPDARMSHPMLHYVHTQWGSFIKQMDEFLNLSPSDIIDRSALKQMLNNKRPHDLGFYDKRLSTILSIMRIEHLYKEHSLKHFDD